MSHTRAGPKWYSVTEYVTEDGEILLKAEVERRGMRIIKTEKKTEKIKENEFTRKILRIVREHEQYKLNF